MRLFNQTICRKCGRPMDTVATIDPMWGKPGLVAFMCNACGGTNSVLIYPDGQAVIARGVADNELAACKEADDKA